MKYFTYQGKKMTLMELQNEMKFNPKADLQGIATLMRIQLKQDAERRMKNETDMSIKEQMKEMIKAGFYDFDKYFGKEK